MLWIFRSTIVLLIYTGMILYTGFRLFAFGRLIRPSLKAWLFWPLFTLFSYGFIVFAVLRFDRLAFIRMWGMYLFPFMICLFGFVFLFDCAALVLFLARKIKRNPLPGGRTLRRLMPRGVGLAIIFTISLLVYCSLHARNIKTTHYDIPLGSETAAAQFRIVLVSDLHIGGTVGNAWTRRIVDAVNGASPDIVCIAGDVFDGGPEGVIDKAGIIAELGRINAPAGVYACPGNHDSNRETRSIEGTRQFLSEAGITLLADEAVPVPLPGGGHVIAAGRRDARPIGMQSGRLSIEEMTALIATSTLADETAGAAAGNNSPVILMDHQPVELPAETETGTIDLVLCGHTHRGQAFPASLLTRAIYKKTGGTHYGYWQKNNTQAIVSSGAGVWGPPIRLGTDSEVVVIDIR